MSWIVGILVVLGFLYGGYKIYMHKRYGKSNKPGLEDYEHIKEEISKWGKK